MKINLKGDTLMKKFFLFFLILFSVESFAQNTSEKLSYHNIKTDSEGNILPWYSNDLGESYDHVINLVWHFWDTMRIDMNGLPYHMNHQVWRRGFNDHRGIGGDQISMALSSWKLYYAYSGNLQVIENMKFMADYYLSHGLSSSNCKWPNIPYPYNTLIYSGIYDGDMIIGKGYTQPDKAGSFGHELIGLYKITGNKRYLEAAIDIANTLSSHVAAGSNDVSPLPFRVNAETGEVGSLIENGKEVIKYTYTSNWTGTMMLFTELVALNKGDVEVYQKSFNTILEWMKNYPLKTNKWGPFFEDVGLWSDTQINAITFAYYILNQHEYFPDWKKDVHGILDWVYGKLGNDKWQKYGVRVVNEQTVYLYPGNSHTSRQASVELLFAAQTGEVEYKTAGIRQLNWATYMVNDAGENSYPNNGNETWMTDGYGDYVRHYLRAMQAYPELMPANQNHLIKSSSVVAQIEYGKDKIRYTTFDISSTETLRLTSKPKEVRINNKAVNESVSQIQTDSWSWTSTFEKGGLLTITHEKNNVVEVIF
jgi:hypothetical protein